MILLSKPFKCGKKQLKKGQMSFFVFVLMCISDQWKKGRGKSILSVKGELAGHLGISFDIQGGILASREGSLIFPRPL